MKKQTGNEERKCSLTEHILIILKENYENGNLFLNASDIAIRAMVRIKCTPTDKYYGVVIQPKTIGSSIGSVRNLADEDCMTILADRKKTEGDSINKYTVTGWRIAGEGDYEYISREIEGKPNNKN